ncbi:pyridoxamine 5'-phosphate oxidase family protein [Arthrobacter deserti]|uniref:Pyridoxamine 5'-phosphate oxidase family protein n=1 Tax=Arthrobacter deserti TaxID=1742687 RepID=A0ABX1JTF7_9MICC|nr:pyridoxamine 5'-phosphate oxidase family protein [Arthrobacter deserti]
MTHHDDGHQEVAKILKKADIAVLTTTNARNQLVSRPLALQAADFGGELWFFTHDPSPKADEIRANPQVNVSVHAGGGYLSIAGTAEIVRDQQKIDQLWNKAVERWFENGRDDPAAALVRVDAHSAEYWTADSPKVATVFKLAKSMVRGKRADVGKNDIIEL